MYYYLDVSQAKIGRVLMLAKSQTRIPDPDTVFGAGNAVELIADKLPFGVVYDEDSKTVRAATIEERKANSMKRLYAGISLLGKVWTKDDFDMDTFVKRAGDSMTGTLNLTGEIPLKIPYGKPINVFKSDGTSALFGKTSGTEIIISDNITKSYINSPTDIKGNLNVNGVVNATGDVIGMSDKRIKKELKSIKDSIDIIKSLNGYRYKLKSDNTKHIGLIAQEVEEILPEAVYTDKDSGYKGIAYGNLAGVFVEALKSILERLEALEEGDNDGKK